ncbi:MAG TPA: uroporphyrinogen-III synthase [Candidatus Dormibacteraeota bacterium]|jgi:uroporphyrinogen III methyltransferase/synthase
MRSILVTRPGGSADPLVGLLEHLHYRVHAVPTVLTEPVEFDGYRLAGFDWIVITSAQGVHALGELPRGPRYAVVGDTTAAALRARGIDAAHVPPHANSAALAESIPEVDGSRIALVRASAASDDLPARLRRRGATVEEITAYRTLEGPAASGPALLAALDDPALAAVVFASGSAVRGFIALAGSARFPAVTIGPRTTAVANELGFNVRAEAEAQSAEALAEAVASVVPRDEGDE